MFAVRLMQEDTVKTGFSHESLHKQEVFASKKPCSYWWKKAPHQPVTKLYGKPCDLVAEEEGEGLGGFVNFSVFGVYS